MKFIRTLSVAVLALGTALAPLPASAFFFPFHPHHIRHIHHIHKVKSVATDSGRSTSPGGNHFHWGWYVAGAGACTTVGLMLNSIDRQMTSAEAERILGDCFLPFVGGWLISQISMNK